MKGVGFILARPAPGSGGKIPLTIEKPIASGYAEAQGALLVDDGSGNWAACGANPASIGAVALTPGGADTSGFNILGRKEFPPLSMQGITLKGIRFLAPFMNALPANPGATYGVTRDSDGVWKVDFSKSAANQVLTYLGVPDRSPADAAGSGEDSLVEVVFLDSVIQVN